MKCEVFEGLVSLCRVKVSPAVAELWSALREAQAQRFLRAGDGVLVWPSGSNPSRTHWRSVTARRKHHGPFRLLDHGSLAFRRRLEC